MTDDYTEQGRPGFLGPERNDAGNPVSPRGFLQSDENARVLHSGSVKPATYYWSGDHGVADGGNVPAHNHAYRTGHPAIGSFCPLCGAPIEEIIGRFTEKGLTP
jgi:hypothetical protein